MLKCANENEDRTYLTGQVILSSICKDAKNTIEELEQEKCELLGIIQKKDELISKLAKELEHLKAQIMKMRGCINCTHFKEYNENIDDYYACELEKCENLEN